MKRTLVVPCLCALLLAAGCPKAIPAAPEGASAPSTSVIYRWQVASAQSTPEPLAQLLRDFYDLHLLMLVSRKADRATVTVGSAVPGDQAQDVCALTSPLPEVTIGADGTFALQGASVTFAAASLQASLYNAQISGTLGAETLTLTAVSGLVDTREFLPLLGSGEPAALCDMIPALGPCVPCADAEPLCWAVSFRGGSATAVSTAFVARSRDEVCADPNCTARCPP